MWGGNVAVLYFQYKTAKCHVNQMLFICNREHQPSVGEVSVAASDITNADNNNKADEMGGLRNRVVCRIVSSTCYNMNRRKTLAEDLMETPLRRCLSTLDITMLGTN